MINKIKDWVFLKYGIQVELRHIWMVLLLIFAILSLVFSLILNSGSGGNKVSPGKMKVMPIPTGGSAVPQVPVAR